MSERKNKWNDMMNAGINEIQDWMNASVNENARLNAKGGFGPLFWNAGKQIDVPLEFIVGGLRSTRQLCNAKIKQVILTNAQERNPFIAKFEVTITKWHALCAGEL